MSVQWEDGSAATGANVKGKWEVEAPGGSIRNLGSVTETTDGTTGVAELKSRKYRASSGDIFRFILTGISAFGGSYETGFPPPSDEAVVP